MPGGRLPRPGTNSGQYRRELRPFDLLLIRVYCRTAWSNRQLAEYFQKTENAIRGQMWRMMTRVGVQTREELMLWAFASGTVDVPKWGGGECGS